MFLFDFGRIFFIAARRPFDCSYIAIKLDDNPADNSKILHYWEDQLKLNEDETTCRFPTTCSASYGMRDR